MKTQTKDHSATQAFYKGFDEGFKNGFIYGMALMFTIIAVLVYLFKP